ASYSPSGLPFTSELGFVGSVPSASSSLLFTSSSSISGSWLSGVPSSSVSFGVVISGLPSLSLSVIVVPFGSDSSLFGIPSLSASSSPSGVLFPSESGLVGSVPSASSRLVFTSFQSLFVSWFSSVLSPSVSFGYLIS